LIIYGNNNNGQTIQVPYSYYRNANESITTTANV